MSGRVLIQNVHIKPMQDSCYNFIHSRNAFSLSCDVEGILHFCLVFEIEAPMAMQNLMLLYTCVGYLYRAICLFLEHALSFGR